VYNQAKKLHRVISVVTVKQIIETVFRTPPLPGEYEEAVWWMMERFYPSHPDLEEAFSDITCLEGFNTLLYYIVEACNELLEDTIGHLENYAERFLFHCWRDPIDPVAVFTDDLRLKKT